MSRMRVLLDGRVISNRFPGIGRYTRSLATALAESGLVDLLLIVDPLAFEAEDGLYKLPRHPRIVTIPVKADPSGLQQQFELPRLARRLSPGIWHAPWYMMPWLRLPCPVVVTYHDAIPLSLPRFWPAHQRAIFRLAHRLSFRRMARGIVVSESAKRDFVNLLGAPLNKLDLVPHGVDLDFTPQDAETVQRFKSAHGLESDYLLYVGINKPSKNLVRLVQAYARMRDYCPPPAPPLVIAGPWDNRYPEPRQAAAAEGVAKWIRFIGTVREVDLPALYCGARFCICPSLQEGFGFPVLEAMACGAPVACSRTSSLPEVAGEAACYFDPERVDQMAEVLMRMTMDAQLRDALRALGLKRAEQFDWEGTARRTVGVYRLALEPPADPSPRQRTPIAINESCA